MATQITMKVDWSVESLLGGDAREEDYDVETSRRNYVTVLERAIEREYPEYDVEVIGGTFVQSSVDVFGDDLTNIDDIAERCHVIQHQIWQRQEWLVDAPEKTLNAVMTAAEAAAEFGLEESTVRKAIERGQLRARKSSGTWLVRRADADAKWGDKMVKLEPGEPDADGWRLLKPTTK